MGMVDGNWKEMHSEEMEETVVQAITDVSKLYYLREHEVTYVPSPAHPLTVTSLSCTQESPGSIRH